MKNESQRSTEHVSTNLASDDYNRQRLSPEYRDIYYIHLSDILLFLDQYKGESFKDVLDYGCGGSPYRPIFKSSNYVRADYVDCGGVDVLIAADGTLNLPDNSFDAVLSTQVLEHVFSPKAYLAEAMRVLKPGGKLILTTHGVWEDHGCPYDFRRWTADGLVKETSDAGFKVTKINKLTTGPRAAVYLFSQVFEQLHASKKTKLGWALWLLKRSAFANTEARHRWMDNWLSAWRIAKGDAAGHPIYLALGIEAVKP